MKKHTIILNYIFLIFWFTSNIMMFGTSVFAEVMIKHPRVAELEEKLSRDANNYLKGRFPENPFTVSVSIDPLRRNTKASSEDKEKIPFLDLQNEEIQDEWDDPQISLQHLMLRIKRVSVSISLPHSISDDEADEVKTSLYSILHLAPARDSVEVVRKKWSTGTQNWSYAAITLVALSMILLGFYFIGNRSASRLAKALSEIKIQTAHSGGPAVTTIANVTSGLSTGSGEHGTYTPHLDTATRNLKLSDPIRIRELIRGLIDTMTAHNNFPVLSDMLALNEYGKCHPHALGSILAEFSPEVQKRLFGITGDMPHWLEAFHKPDVLDIESLNLLEKLARISRDDTTPEWENLLIYIWRLGINAADFLQELDYEDSMIILAKLPKSISIRIARWAFPGNWGRLLNFNVISKPLDSKKILKITQQALEKKPLIAYTSLTQYQNDLDLVDYLRIADIPEERDIYGAAPSGSLIFKVRKPFFPIFDQADEILNVIVPKFSPEEWALALLNVTIPDRKKIDSHFSEKQKFLFIERLKFYDANPPGNTVVGKSRDKIARVLGDMLSKTSNPSKLSKKILESTVQAQAPSEVMAEAKSEAKPDVKPEVRGDKKNAA